MAYIFVNVNRSVGTINPNIYGQFSEHLGLSGHLCRSGF